MGESPPCGRSIKTYARGNNDAPSITKYGSPVWLDAQIVALRAHCTQGAPIFIWVLNCSVKLLRIVVTLGGGVTSFLVFRR